ncbi:uncharacterized protein B0H18DRAFT_1057524 [Fomitopsis serialis]|uniref:uncharacterized protein n=1 Tax=Fomitopsis serialis TaxID=139415 RepID=UPI002007E34F|nr:uncharacterized protein B0H18DRAFT_1057524 [Neoantrodia serialis]KAH9911859.1 hypothetical protein B0H18DRAFT_1057524 [Neoantrodia serialis]
MTTPMIDAHSPAIDFPLEILQEIFLHYRDLVHGLSQGKPHGRQNVRPLKYSSGYDWIAVSHVCRRWRAGVVHCPPLWTHLAVTRSAEWMSEVLARSGNMLLHVTAELGTTLGGNKTQAFRTILAQLHRIGSLHISGAVGDEILPLLANSAPRLKRLVLDHVALPTPADLKNCDDAYTYFPYFLQRDLTPRLEHLELDAFQPQFQGPCADSLKRLVFCHRVADMFMGMRYTGPCLRGLLDALQNMPSLESVAFDKEAHVTLNPAAEAELQASLPDVVLPHLRSMYVHATAEESVALLDHLSLPALANITLSCARNSTEYPETLPVALVHTLETLPETRALHLARFTGTGFHRYMCFTGYAALASGSAPVPTFDIMVDRGYGREEIVPSVCQALPLQAVRELTIDSQEDMSESAWLALLGALPNLASIAVAGSFAPYKLRDVRMRLEGIKGMQVLTEDSPTCRSIPSLRTVELRTA